MSVTHEIIASQLNLARSTVTRILNNDPNYRASGKTRKKVFDLARKLNYDFSNLRRIHRRKYERVPVDIPIRARILLPDGSIHDEGEARLLDLNPIGALVGDFRFHKQTIPLMPFSLEIEVVSGELTALRARARIARITMSDGVQMGIEFANVESAASDRIKEYLGIP